MMINHLILSRNNKIMRVMEEYEDVPNKRKIPNTIIRSSL